MKTFFSVILVGLSLSASASEQCLDIRATMFAPCQPGEQRFFVQGQCTKSWEAESSYCAPKATPECLDTRLIDLGPCEEGKTWVFVQGRCSESYEVEHMYCAVR